MDERKALIDAMARVKPKTRARIYDAVDAVIRIVWEYRSPEFNFLGIPEIDAEVNAILVAMSDGNRQDAEDAALRLLEELDYKDWVESLEYANREIGGQSPLFRLDMHASHLKEILAGWIIVAAVAGITKAALLREIMANMGNPFASKLWREAGLKPLSWGKGYARDVLEGMTVIGQDFINMAFQYAKVQDFRRQGAIGYRTVRNSNYDCPFCDEMSKIVWPLDQVVLPYHPRCVCLPVPVFENETL